MKFYDFDTEQFTAAVKEFGKTKREVYGSYAYYAGYMESLSIRMFQMLTKSQKQSFLNEIIAANEKTKPDVSACRKKTTNKKTPTLD